MRIGVVVMLGVTAVTGCTNPGEQQLADLVGDPDATLAFFYPDGVVEPGTSPVAIDYIRDRKWSGDGFGLLAQVLDEAATAHRRAEDPLAELSALAAADTINLLGERHDEIGDTAYDSLGHLLSNYIVDVDIASQPMPSSLGGPYPVLDDLPPGAHFNAASLDVVMGQVLQSTEAFRDVTAAALQLNAFRTAAAVDNNDRVAVGWAMDEDVDLLHYIGVTAGFVHLTEQNERTDAMFDQLELAAALQPAPHARFADYLAGGEPLTPVGTVSLYRDGNPRYIGYGLSEAIWTVTRLNTACQLGHAGLLTTTGPTGEPYTWAIDGEFDVNAALDNSGDFLENLHVQNDWGRMFRRIGKARLNLDG